MPMASPWMTATNALQRQPSAFERPMLPYSFYAILGTAWRIATTCTEKGRQKPLINLNKSQKNPADNFIHQVHAALL